MAAHSRSPIARALPAVSRRCGCLLPGRAEHDETRGWDTTRVLAAARTAGYLRSRPNHAVPRSVGFQRWQLPMATAGRGPCVPRGLDLSHHSISFEDVEWLIVASS